MKSKLIALVAFGLLALAPAAQATFLDYEFTVTIGTTDYDGTFSFDSTLATPGADHQATGLLSSLYFPFMGTTYDETMANTGWLTFDAAAMLSSFAFGTDCAPGSCTVGSGTYDWYIGQPPPPGAITFAYDLGSGYMFADNVEWRQVSVPEPSMLALLSVGLAGLGFTRRRMKA